MLLELVSFVRKCFLSWFALQVSRNLAMSRAIQEHIVHDLTRLGQRPGEFSNKCECTRSKNNDQEVAAVLVSDMEADHVQSRSSTRH